MSEYQVPKITGVTLQHTLQFLLFSFPHLKKIPSQDNVSAQEVEEVLTVRPEVSAPQDGTEMMGCRWMMLDRVRLVSTLSFKLFWHHPCVHPHPERRRGNEEVA